MIDPNALFPTKTDAPSAAYPYGSARNVTLPGDGTGSPWDEAVLNDWWGFGQDVMDKAGIVPSGSPDEVDASQLYEAMAQVLSPPGSIVPGGFNDTPVALSLRMLDLDGSVILVANYPELVANTWVGAVNNNAAYAAGAALYKSSDALGFTPDPLGTYFKLPDMRGNFLRGYDPAGIRDPDGVGRYLSERQVWAMYDHRHDIYNANQSSKAGETLLANGSGVAYVGIATATGSNFLQTFDTRKASDNSLLVANVDQVETRPTNVNLRMYMRY